MAQFVVRNIENDVKRRLRRRAARNGRSMEEEVREILREAVNDAKNPDSSGGLGSEIASFFADLDFEGEIPELRGHKIKPASFGK